jgi:hypothetical protein
METNNKQLLTSKKDDDGRELITEPYRHDEDGKERLDD